MTFGHLKSSLVLYMFSMLYIYICKTFLNVSVEQIHRCHHFSQWLCKHPVIMWEKMPRGRQFHFKKKVNMQDEPGK